jgi:PE family
MAMSFVIAAPEFVTAAASAPTTGVLAAGADEVSAVIAGVFGAHAQGYQALSAQAAALHNELVQLLNAGAGVPTTELGPGTAGEISGLLNTGTFMSGLFGVDSLAG